MVLVVVVVTSLDLSIALVPTLPRLFKRKVHEIQKNRIDVSGHKDERERKTERDVRIVMLGVVQDHEPPPQTGACNPKSLMFSDHM